MPLAKSLIEAAGNSTQPNYIEDVFSTYLYTGDASARDINNNIDLSTKGGMVWTKKRSAAYDHFLFDTARGVNVALKTNSTGANDAGSNMLTAFNTNGFSLGTSANVNGNSATYASWTFRKQPKFFDVVTFTAPASGSLTVNHSLTSTPGFIVIKRTDSTGDWLVYHRSTGANQYLLLNGTAAATTYASIWPNVTSTSFEVTAGVSVIANGTYVAYIFAHDAGGFGLTGTDNVISCGTYTGTGAAGNAITLGYEPQFLLVKATSTTSNWVLIDTMRGAPNTTGSDTAQLFPNLSNAEGRAGLFFPTATGFQSIGASFNTSAATYIYIAIRRGPMKTPTDGTKVFAPVAFTESQTDNLLLSSGFDAPSVLFSQQRAGTYLGPNMCYSRLRGQGYLQTNSTAAEDTSVGAAYEGVWSQTGITGGAAGSASLNDTSGDTRVNWFFKRAPSFFDEVCYTGTGSATTFSHNLGAVPEMMIVKSRSRTGENWPVYHKDLGTTIGTGNLVYLDQTLAATTNSDGPACFGNGTTITTPTSSVFTVGTQTLTNANTSTYVAYLFATCAGVSKVGSYTGTGTTKQVDCGFAAGARFVLIKRTDSTGDWYVWDTARGIVSGNDPYLLLNSTAAEVTSTDYIDTYSSGFELSSTAPAALNASGGTYIFLAIA
jgi:hypothetical protein